MKFEDGTTVNFTIHGCGNERFSRDKVMSLIKTLKPDLFGVLLDTFMLYEAGFTGLNFSPAIPFFYFPTDGEPTLPLSCEKLFTTGTFHHAIAMAKRGQAQVKEAHGINADYIPHAVNEKLFKPMDKDKLREKWSKRLGVNLLGKKIIGTVARNQGRKMMDRMIPIMKEIAKQDDNTIYLLHTDPYDRASYFNMMAEIQRNNLENRFVFTGLNFLNPYTYQEVAEIYNLFDIFLLTTTGEGFGIPIIEAMACEVPVVCTDFTTTQELVKDNNAGVGIKLSEIIMGSWNVQRGICSVTDAAEKCVAILNNPILKETMGKNGRAAVLREYTWDIVIKQWVELLNKYMKEGY